MASEYKLRIIATGDGGEEITSTTTIEADSPENAKEQFTERTSGVSYWSLAIDNVEAVGGSS